MPHTEIELITVEPLIVLLSKYVGAYWPGSSVATTEVTEKKPGILRHLAHSVHGRHLLQTSTQDIYLEGLPERGWFEGFEIHCVSLEVPAEKFYNGAPVGHLTYELGCIEQDGRHYEQMILRLDFMGAEFDFMHEQFRGLDYTLYREVSGCGKILSVPSVDMPKKELFFPEDIRKL